MSHINYKTFFLGRGPQHSPSKVLAATTFCIGMPILMPMSPIQYHIYIDTASLFV